LKKQIDPSKTFFNAINTQRSNSKLNIKSWFGKSIKTNGLKTIKFQVCVDRGRKVSERERETERVRERDSESKREREEREGGETERERSLPIK
jgi:hypothetical protein